MKYQALNPTTYLGPVLLLLAPLIALSAEQPNFVIMMADDLGYGDIGCYGSERIKTPHLDRLAAEGMRLTDFHSSGAVCSPTRAGLMTGRYQQRAGIPAVIVAAPNRPTHPHGIQDREVTFAELLAAAGYQTAIFGKWHLGYYRKYNPVRHGFGKFRGYISGNVDFFSHVDQAGRLDWWRDDQIDDEPGYTTHLITRHSLAFIEANRDKPFCLYVPYEPPHYPYQGPHDKPMRAVGKERGQSERRQSRTDVQRAYREMVEEMDKGVGQIVAALKEHGMERNTLVMFFSDNGGTPQGSNGPLRGHKGQVWEGGHRVPCIARWPGTIQAGSVSDDLTITLDVMPTILAAADVDRPTDRKLDGINLLPLLTEGKSPGPRQLFWGHGNSRAMRDGPWKLVTGARGQQQPALYNLAHDLAEQSDLAAQEPARLKKMMAAIEVWEKDTSADAHPAKPNIVVFLVDDMGVMDTSVPFLTDQAGKPQRYPLNDYYRTPSMERLAAQGIRLNNFYAMSVCSPTRISIMTGQNAARHHTTNWINPSKDNRGPSGPPQWNWKGLTKSDVTLPRLLQGAGYHTIHVGKGHFGPRSFEGAEPQNLGFDVNVGGRSFGAPASYYGMKNYGHGQKRASHAVPHLEKYHGTDTFLTEALTIEVKSRVTDAVQAGKPFYLYLSHYAVHAPFNSDPRFAAHYQDSGKPAAAQAFATLIEGMDKSLGDVLDHLDALGVADNTLIFFLGDNGSDAPLGHQHAVACAAPLRGKKGAHYEGGMRVPFIAAWAKARADNPHQQRLPIPAGSIQSQQAGVCDLFPTILALTDVPLPESHLVDGVRLDTLLAGKPDDTREETFLMHYPHSPHRSNYFTCYRRGDWKVVYHYFPSKASEDSHYQLYHLAADPFESHNLAASKPDQLRLMMQGLIASLEKHNALYPVDKQDGATPLPPKLP